MSDDYAGLTSAERDRLERFAAEFEDIDPLDYGLFAGTTAAPDEIEAAQVIALQTLGTTTRRTSAAKAADSFVAAASRALGRVIAVPGMVIGSRSMSLDAEQRARFVAALERAVIAVILWPDLRDDEQAALAGPWERVIGRAVD